MYLLCKLPGDLDGAAACARSVLNLPSSNGAPEERQKRHGLNIGGGYYYCFSFLGLDLCLCRNAGEVAIEGAADWPYYFWFHSDGDFSDLLRRMSEKLASAGIATTLIENA